MSRLPSLLTILLLAGAACVAASGQSTRPQQAAPPDRDEGDATSPIEEAIWQLAAEARRAELDRTLPAHPDYAERCTLPLTPADVAGAIRTRHFEKVFPDGYARWQLTSFDPPLVVADDAAMVELVRLSPGLAQNPYASARTVRFFKAMVDMGDLGEQELQYLQERRATLDSDLAVTKQFMRPLEEVRAWMLDRLDDPVHRALWLVGECVARASAGWPVSETDVPARTEAAIARVATDPAIPAERRRVLAGAVHAITETNREVVTSVTVEENRSVNASILWAAVDDATVRRWEAMLRPPADASPGKP